MAVKSSSITHHNAGIVGHRSRHADVDKYPTPSLPLILIFLPPLPIQLINHLLPTRQYLQRATFIIVIPRLRHKPIRRYRAGYHERAHNLQHAAEVALLPVVLALRVVCEEDLYEPGPEFAGGGGDTVACAAVARGEDFGWNLETC